MECIIEDALIDLQTNTSSNRRLILQELLRTFMNQISSLKFLHYDSCPETIGDIPFVSFPGAKGSGES